MWPTDTPNALATQTTSDSDLTHTEPTGKIARYAWGDDYHRVMKKRLFQLADALKVAWPDHAYRVAVDTAPILEREHALRAGLGWIGKHTLLIHPTLGSWLLLGQIVTTLELQPNSSPQTDHCGTCTRCIDACPTGCITPFELDASRCISYLTIEHRGPIEPALHGDMQSWVAGCDVCQEVCPFNRPVSSRESEPPPPIHPRYALRPPGPEISLIELLGWDTDARRVALQASALKRIKLDMFKRNALIAAGNYLMKRQHPQLQHRVEQIAIDSEEPPLVRHTARQVLQRLAQSKP